MVVQNTVYLETIVAASIVNHCLRTIGVLDNIVSLGSCDQDLSTGITLISL